MGRINMYGGAGGQATTVTTAPLCSPLSRLCRGGLALANKLGTVCSCGSLEWRPYTNGGVARSAQIRKATSWSRSASSQPDTGGASSAPAQHNMWGGGELEPMSGGLNAEFCFRQASVHFGAAKSGLSQAFGESRAHFRCLDCRRVHLACLRTDSGRRLPRGHQVGCSAAMPLCAAGSSPPHSLSLAVKLSSSGHGPYHAI